MIRVFLKLFPHRLSNELACITPRMRLLTRRRKKTCETSMVADSAAQIANKKCPAHTIQTLPASIFSPAGVFFFNFSSAYSLPSCFRKCGLPLTWKPLVTFHKERKKMEGREGEEPALAMPPVGKTNKTLEW